jgi:hypothetical protein
MRGRLLVSFACSAAACGGSSASTPPATDSGTPPLDAAIEAGAIGAPCIPLVEGSTTFDGFIVQEVDLAGENWASPSGASLCIADHFQGRVTCPYGQDAQRRAPAGASPCTTPDGQAVEGAVRPWCTDRPASKTVTWSCRCANAKGDTNDGRPYCVCPASTTCTQLIPQVGAAEYDLTGAFCVPNATAFDPNSACLTTCDPATHPCP